MAVLPNVLSFGLCFLLSWGQSNGKPSSDLGKLERSLHGGKYIRRPVILVPGDGGSQFEARLNKSSAVHIWCTKKSDWFSLWLNLEQLAPYVLDCFVDNMRLYYDQKTHKTYNSPGVFTRQPGFGNTSSVEWLDPSQLSPTAYFNPIVDALFKAGWKRNVNVHGAPYDFRKAPNEMKDFMRDLVKLIEKTYEVNHGQKVILVAHSMGNPTLLYLFNHQSQSWKDKYIHSQIALAGPWGGAAKTLRLMASGDNLGVFLVNPLSARPQQRSMPSTAWLIPYDTFWNASDVIVSGPKGNYTVKDYHKFFQDIDYMDGYYMRQDTEPLIKDFKPPGVTVHCLHGVGKKTPAKFHYAESQWYDDQPTVTYGPGDGTVNLHSLHGCLRWQKKQKQTVYHKEFPGVDHMGILADKDIISYILKVASDKI